MAMSFTAMAQQVTARHGSLLCGYLAAVSGSAGRLVFSLAYFVVLANSLSIADFGLFATASAAGVMLSRMLAFGFVSPLYRVATVRPRLIGTYAVGFILLALISMPLLGLAALAVHALFFGQELALSVFAVIIAAETLLWRPAEVVIIVNNGMNRFAHAAALVIAGTALRAGAAILFMFSSESTLAAWAWFYAAANAVILAAALLAFFPRSRFRFRPGLYWRSMQDSLSVALADLMFYLQSEMDKLLILALGGPTLAGLYAIVMRLVDLTAIPVRAFTMMLVQHLMRVPEALAQLRVRIGVEAMILAVSTTGLVAAGLLLHVKPDLLGANIAEAAPVLLLALLVPGLRNLIEYQAELLYARGQTIIRVINLTLLAGAKALLLSWLLMHSGSVPDLMLALNGVFALLYAGSALLTYSAMRLPARPV
jgi:O-antigen/teichoic acid export membrane protein